MLVIRYTNIIKPGLMDELLAAYAHLVKAVDYPHAVRAYVSVFGPLDVLNIESEWDSLEEYERFRATLAKVPESDAFYAKLKEAREAGGSREIWNLVE
jgi:hypothetical protein